MPIYTVEGPDGRRYKIEGPEGATAEQLSAVIQQQSAPAPSAEPPAAAEQGMGERLSNANSVMRSGLLVPVQMARSVAGEVAGGLAGAGTFVATGGDVDKAVSAQDATRDFISGTPDAAQTMAMQAVAAPAAGVAAWTDKAREELGDAAYEQAGPAAGTLAYTAPDLLTALIPGAKAAQLMRRIDKRLPTDRAALPPPRDVPGEQVQRTGNTLPAQVADHGEQMAEKIRSGSTDGEVAAYKLDDWQGVKRDPQAEEVIKQGFDEGVVAAIKQASPLDRKQMRKMLELRQKGHRNQRFAMDNRPADVAGESLQQRVRHVKRVNRKAGRALEQVARDLRGKQVDYGPPVRKFIENLRGIGVSLDDGLKPVFRNSDIEGVDAAERVVRNIVGRMRNTKVPDAYDLHRLKRFIDEHVTYGKSADGLGGKTERILKQLRKDLDNTLDSTFDEYNRVNTTYADTVGVLDDIQGVVGTKVDLFGDNADKALGVELRKLMNNTKGRANMMTSLDELESVATRYGGRFDDDIKTQMLFADELDKLFGSSARTSLQGVTEAAVETAVGARGMGDLSAEVARAGINKVRGVNHDNAFKAMRELLSQ